MMRTPPTTRESELLELVTRRINPQGRSYDRVLLDQKWFKNLCFYSGKQHFYWEDGALIDASKELSEHQVLYMTNIVRNAVLRNAAMIMDVNARLGIAPQTETIRARQLADVSLQVFNNHIRKVTEYDDAIAMVQLIWRQCCGSSILKTTWNQHAGERQRIYLETKDKNSPVVLEEEMTHEQKRGKEEAREYVDTFIGEIAAENINLFGFYHDTSSREKAIRGCRWAGEHHWMDIDDFAEMVDVDPEDLAPDGESRGLENYEEALAFMGSNNFTSPFQWTEPEEKRGHRLTVRELWLRPSALEEYGAHVIVANGRVWNRDTKNPYAADRSGRLHIPYIKADWSPHPGRFYGSSLVEDMTSPQFQLNAARAAQATYVNEYGYPPTWLDRNSGINPKDVTMRPGAVYSVETTMSKGILPVTYPQLPPDIWNFGAVAEQDALKAASQAESSGDKLPGQLRSGDAVRAMNDERHRALSIPARQHVRSIRDFGINSLKLYQLFSPEERTLRYVGQDGRFAVRSFIGADLENEVVLIGEPSITDTLASRKGEVLDAVQAGALQPAVNPMDRRLFIEAMHFGSSDEMVTVLVQGKRHQEREILRMIEDPLKFGDIGYPVLEWEDHEAHIASLQTYMSGEEFVDIGVNAQAIIAKHLHDHQEQLANQQAQAAQLAAAMKGTPGQKGVASQPAR
jgi:hypothetical protein